tara:strand:- start:564 stop:995 length:432 start_codon:yes stop_codon:yes gene_type:complete
MENFNTIRKDAFLYGYIDKNVPFPFVVYCGSSSRTSARESLTNEELLEQVDLWHRKKGPAQFLKSTKNGGKYAYTDWRRKLQFNFKDYAEDNWEIVFLSEPKDMTLEEHLTLEGDKIKELQSKGQALLNQDVDPLKSWRKYNS